MNRRFALLLGLGALLLGRSAIAQQEVTIGYQGLPYKSTGETNTGIQLSDGVLLHAGIGVEGGYDTNVFYAATNPQGSSIIRVMPYAELTNATRTGAASRELTFDVRGGLEYRHYGSSDSNVQAYSDAWMPNGGVSLNLGGGALSFGIADIFARIEDPPYQSQFANAAGMVPLIIRNNNQASAEVRWLPGGGRLVGTLRLTNMIDYYTGTYAYANAMTNTLMLDVSWKWLPKTAAFVNVQQGFIDYLNDLNPNKVASYPLHATIGLRGLLTEKTSAVLSVGYANAFYSEGESTSGFWGSTFAELAFTLRPTQLSRFVVGARHDFLNAVISNFAYEDAVYVSWVQQLAGRLALDLSGRYAHLSYQGNLVDPTQPGRVDNFFQAGATLDYFMRNWVYVGVGYSLLDNRSNYPTNDYLKQQVFARLGVTY